MKTKTQNLKYSVGYFNCDGWKYFSNLKEAKKYFNECKKSDIAYKKNNPYYQCSLMLIKETDNDYTDNIIKEFVIK